MQRKLLPSLALILPLALLITLCMALPAAAHPPAPDDQVTTRQSMTAPLKPIDRPTPRDFQRNQQRLRLLETGEKAAAGQLTLTGTDRVLVILVEFAGTDTFTWQPGDAWDPLGRADPAEAVTDDRGNVVLGDCSRIITQTTTFTYTGPLHNQIPQPLSADDRSGAAIWTEDFDRSWFEAFLWGDGVVFDYTRADGSRVLEDRRGLSVRDYFLDLSGGRYALSGDVVGWVQVPHSAWYYGADQCPGARSGGGGNHGAIPGAGNQRQLVRHALNAVNAAYPRFDWQRYDQDRDGMVDHLWIVHAGYGEEEAATLLNRTPTGEAAIWSHAAALEPPQRVAAGVAAGPYIVTPENGGIGIFAHEHSHHLGAIDLYAYGPGETSAGFWTLMADDWTGHPIGFQPPALDPLHLDGWGWLDPLTIADPSQVVTVTLGQASRFPGGAGVQRAVKITLPDGELPLPVPVWQGERYWWGGAANSTDGMLTTASAVAIPAGGAVLTFDLAYDLEAGWDFLWVQASPDGVRWDTLANAATTCQHAAGWSGGSRGFPADLCAAGLGGFSGRNPGWPAPQRQEFDLAAYAGQSIHLRLWHMTDWDTLGAGPMVDAVAVLSGGQVLFADDAESADTSWLAAPPWQRTPGQRTFTHSYYLQWRNTGPAGGYDSALGDARWRFGPANSGLLVWYNNNLYPDNEIWDYLADFPGWGPKGRMLVVDAHPAPYRDPDLIAMGYNNEASNLWPRSQMRDAPFSRLDSASFRYTDTWAGAQEHLYPGRPAVSAFNDALGYAPGGELTRRGSAYPLDEQEWLARQWDASVVLPAQSFYGVAAPGYASGDQFRFACTAQLDSAPPGRLWCASGNADNGLGYAGGAGNPGDQAAQYGWHVEIIAQSSMTATVRIWNAIP